LKKDFVLYENNYLASTITNINKVGAEPYESINGSISTLSFQKLAVVNEKVRELASLSPESAPSFIAKDKIAFMSGDNVILCYQVFDTDK
jgi:hypothetical protein